MCILPFSPGATLHIDYAAETITIKGGGRTDVVDFLITNHSTHPIGHIHFIYPNAIPLEALNHSSGEPAPSLSDLTSTLLDNDSPYNEFYSNEYTSRSIVESPEKSQLKVTMINPADITTNVEYTGYIKGTQDLFPYEVADTDRLTRSEWKLLAALGWSVFTIKFKVPLAPGDPRWLRLRGETGLLSVNDMSPGERMLRRYLGILSDSFEIAGPLDVRYRLRTALSAAGVGKPASSSGAAKMLFQDLFRKLITDGTDHPDTITIVKDYRLNIFTYEYRRCDDPVWWGDVVPSGPLLNRMKLRSGRHVSCYQWKAGEHTIKKEVQAREGRFGVRILAYDDPTLRILLPWVALALSIIGVTLGLINLLLRLFGSPFGPRP